MKSNFIKASQIPGNLKDSKYVSKENKGNCKICVRRLTYAAEKNSRFKLKCPLGTIKILRTINGVTTTLDTK